MLPFHDAISRDLQRGDSLVILARGLGLPYALCSHILNTLTTDSLILLLNFPSSQIQQILHPLLHSLHHRFSASLVPLLLPRHLNSSFSASDRLPVYQSRGLIIPTPSILVHDLLHHTIDPVLVSHVFVYAAESVPDGSNTHFALNLLKTANPNLPISAFSDQPIRFIRGFHYVVKLMRILHVGNLVLYPRFHASVKDNLKSHKVDLLHLSVPLSTNSGALAGALHDTIRAVLEDLRKATGELDLSEVYKEVDGKQTIVWRFNDLVRRQLEGAEVRMTARVRSLLDDLGDLRSLLSDVFDLDSVSFYQRIATMRHSAGTGSNWLIRKQAQRAVFLARSRVWIVKKVGAGDQEQGMRAVREMEIAGEEPVRTKAVLERPGKWVALKKVLAEIREDAAAVGHAADVGRVLVIVKDGRSVDELSEMMAVGEDAYMKTRFQVAFPRVAERVRIGDEAEKGMRQVTLTQMARGGGPDGDAIAEKTAVPNKELPERTRRVGKSGSMESEKKTGWREEQSVEELKRVFEEVKFDSETNIEVLIWSMEWLDLQGRGHRILEEYHPAFVVLYNSELAVVRQVEVYKAMHPGRPVRMYILAYEGSQEEYRFQCAATREKNSFKSLIRERATMSVHVEEEGNQSLQEFTQALIQQSVEMGRGSGRRGLGADRDSRKVVALQKQTGAKKGGKILVDTRELRSKLPMLLYQSSLKIVPITLEVADFVLSRNIGIERKSVSDLYGSFASGRLFNQAEALCRHYKYPCLLIELDRTKSLSLSATQGGVPREMSVTSITSKMVLLIQQFPNLRLLWAKGPNDAAKLFEGLKTNEEEPDEELAASLGVDSKEDDDTFNAGPRALLRSLPGIDSQNMGRVMRKVRNVASLMTMTQEEMTELLGNPGKATMLYNFVNEEPSEAVVAL